MGLKNYSMAYIFFVLIMLLGQLFASDITLSSISETFLWKKSLIKVYGNFKYQIGDRVFTNAVIGKEGWLYFTGDKSIQSYQKTSSLTVRNIKELATLLGEIEDQTEKYGGTFLLVIPPDKNTVYPQYMPDEIPVIGQSSNLDRLVEYLGKKSHIQVLDFRPLFAVLSKSTDIYYKTDTHWNCLGAFYASNEILSLISNSYPQIHPYALDDFNFSRSEASTRDIPKMMGVDIREESINLTPRFDTYISQLPLKDADRKIPSLQITVNETKDLPTLLVFRDSFYKCAEGFIEPNFSRTMSMHFMDVEFSGYLDIIAAEKPDIVILEFVERSMDIFYRHSSR